MLTLISDDSLMYIFTYFNIQENIKMRTTCKLWLKCLTNKCAICPKQSFKNCKYFRNNLKPELLSNVKHLIYCDEYYNYDCEPQKCNICVCDFKYLSQLKLKHLELYYDSKTYTCFKIPKTIKTFKLFTCYDNISQWYKYFPKNLTELTLWSVMIKDEELKCIQDLPLTKFTLFTIEHVNDDYNFTYLPKTIVYLHIKYDGDLSLGTFKHINTLPLKKLILHNINITGEFLNNLPKSLTYLELNCMITNKIVVNLFNLPLTHFKLKYRHFSCDSLILNLPKTIINLDIHILKITKEILLYINNLTLLKRLILNCHTYKFDFKDKPIYIKPNISGLIDNSGLKHSFSKSIIYLKLNRRLYKDDNGEDLYENYYNGKEPKIWSEYND
jgi:hypothetical protein